MPQQAKVPVVPPLTSSFTGPTGVTTPAYSTYHQPSNTRPMAPAPVMPMLNSTIKPTFSQQNYAAPRQSLLSSNY